MAELLPVSFTRLAWGIVARNYTLSRQWDLHLNLGGAAAGDSCTTLWKGLGTSAVFIKTDPNVEKCPFLAQDPLIHSLLKSLPLRVRNGQRSVCPSAGTAGAAGWEQPAEH